MIELKFKYIWKRPKSGAGPYRPTDAKTVVSYSTLTELEKGKQPKSPMPCSYYLIVARCLYIGRKDKNGKEIYEGDIVKSPEWDNMQEVTYTDIEASDDMTAPGIGYQFNTYPENMEVIGNIYENPELLEKPK